VSYGHRPCRVTFTATPFSFASTLLLLFVVIIVPSLCVCFLVLCVRCVRARLFYTVRSHHRVENSKEARRRLFLSSLAFFFLLHHAGGNRKKKASTRVKANTSKQKKTPLQLKKRKKKSRRGTMECSLLSHIACFVLHLRRTRLWTPLPSRDFFLFSSFLYRSPWGGAGSAVRLPHHAATTFIP
jgi:hypothetical protein